MNFQTQYNHDKDVVDQALGTYFQDDTAPYHALLEAMRYSLMAGGKRIRPVLCMKFCEAAGGTMEEALDFGCGVVHVFTQETRAFYSIERLWQDGKQVNLSGILENDA